MRKDSAVTIELSKLDFCILWNNEMHIARKMPKGNVINFCGVTAIRIPLYGFELWMLMQNKLEDWRRQK
jgi:hypothetical protein